MKSQQVNRLKDGDNHPLPPRFSPEEEETAHHRT
jgi:hypothetical protein